MCWTPPPATSWLTVANPGPADAEVAIEAANAAWLAWRRKTAKERSIIQHKWFDLLMANQGDLGAS